jgi:hypothetical protein
MRLCGDMVALFSAGWLPPGQNGASQIGIVRASKGGTSHPDVGLATILKCKWPTDREKIFVAQRGPHPAATGMFERPVSRRVATRSWRAALRLLERRRPADYNVQGARVENMTGSLATAGQTGWLCNSGGKQLYCATNDDAEPTTEWGYSAVRKIIDGVRTYRAGR